MSDRQGRRVESLLRVRWQVETYLVTADQYVLVGESQLFGFASCDLLVDAVGGDPADVPECA